MLRLLVLTVLACLILPALAQDGHHGHGHMAQHDDFYKGLMRNGFNCCNDQDCRPTESRTVNGFYEVKVEGVWSRVPPETILRRSAPDGGAHVCAPKQGGPEVKIYCVVLPPEI